MVDYLVWPDGMKRDWEDIRGMKISHLGRNIRNSGVSSVSSKSKSKSRCREGYSIMLTKKKSMRNAISGDGY